VGMVHVQKLLITACLAGRFPHIDDKILRTGRGLMRKFRLGLDSNCCQHSEHWTE
jgi:hypothetical protein